MFKHTEEMRQTLLNQTTDCISKLLADGNNEENPATILRILNNLLEFQEEEILYNRNVIVLVYLAEKYTSGNNSYLADILDEFKKKTIRRYLLGGPNTALSKCTEVFHERKDMEQYLPKNGEFLLPPVGEVGNLVVTNVDSEGNPIIRNVLIDHEGYVVREISRETDNAEEATYSDFNEDMRKIMEDEDTTTARKQTETMVI